MSGVVNTVLNFFSEQWELVVYVTVASVLLVIAYKLVRRFGQSEDDSTPFPSETPGNYDAEKHRLQGFVNELRSHINELKQRIGRLTNQNAVLAPLIKELNSNLDRERMGPIVLRTLERIFSPKHALVFFTEADGKTLSLVANAGVHGLPEGYRQEIGYGFAGLVASKRRTVTKEDLYRDPNFTMLNVDDLGPDAEGTDIATPIMNRDEPLGVLCMGGMREFNEDEQALFGMIANMTALALMNYRQYKKIEELANHDQLTGVFNKGHFIREATKALVEANRDATHMSLLMFDVDHFKHYNDTNGHLAGDRLLKALAEILSRMTRARDIVGRFGGEEFIILLHGVGLAQARDAAEAIRQAVAEFPFEHGERQPLGGLTVSVGVAAMPEHGARLETLTQRADEALYVAKNNGRNRVLTAAEAIEVKAASM